MYKNKQETQQRRETVRQLCISFRSIKITIQGNSRSAI